MLKEGPLKYSVLLSMLLILCMFWDRQTEIRTLGDHADLLPDHSTMSRAAPC